MKTTLQKWAAAHYGDNAPHIKTLRRWVREGKIFPAPRKDGRTYFVEHNARYVGSYSSSEYLGRVRDAAQAQ